VDRSAQRGNALRRRTYVGRPAPRGLRTIPIAFVVVLAAAGCAGPPESIRGGERVVAAYLGGGDRSPLKAAQDG